MQLELDYVVIELASVVSVQIIVGDLFTVVNIDSKFIDLADVLVIMLDTFDIVLVKNFNKALNIVVLITRELAWTRRGLNGSTEDILSSRLYPKTPRYSLLLTTTMLSTFLTSEKSSKIEL